MARRYCPICKEIGEVKVLMNGYRQEVRDGIPVKIRKLVHLREDGGCGGVFESYEAYLKIVEAEHASDA